MPARRTPGSYRAEIRKLKHMVADMLWVQPTYNGSPSCSYCGQQQHLHRNHCAATKLIAEEWPADDEARVRAVLRG